MDVSTVPPSGVIYTLKTRCFISA